MCVALCSGPGLFFAWPEIGTFQKKLQRCSMAWIQWFLALRLQAPEFSILSVARRTYFFLTQNYQLMISGYEASRARLLYSEQGSQDIYFPYTRSIQIGDEFWFWGFKGQISLFWAWLPGHTFSFYKLYPNWRFLALRVRGPNFPTSSVALRTYIFFIQGVSKFIISDSEASRTRSLYSERGSQDVQFPCTKLI